MIEREKFVVMAALLYAQSNLDELNQAFENDEEISVNGNKGKPINEIEIKILIDEIEIFNDEITDVLKNR